MPPLEGVDLPAFLTAWTTALRALIVDRAATAQVSIEHPTRELCLLRQPGLGVELSVVALDPEPQLVVPKLSLELTELRSAVEQMTRGFVRSAGVSVPPEALVALERALKDATGRAITPFPVQAVEPWRFVKELGALKLELLDTDGRTLQVTKGSGGLSALLTEGTFATSSQPPFLALMAEVRRRPSAEAFQLGLAVCAALHERQSGWATNPWVDALFVRCTEGLAALRSPTPDLGDAPHPRASAPKQTTLAPVGAPRRVTLTPRWSRPVALGEPKGRLLLSGKCVVAHTAHAAQVFSLAGKELRRVHAARGVAAAANGTVIVATDEKLSCLPPQARSACWIRDDGGIRLGPDLEEADGRWLTRLSARGIVALESMTGREAWRFDPPRTQKSVTTRLGDRLLVGTDAGELYGVDVHDGEVRFRIRGPAASQWPVAPLQRDGVAVFASSSQAVVTRFAALAQGAGKQAGAVSWTKPLPLESASAPVTVKGKIFIGGRSDGRGAIACLSGKGEVLWLRSVPLEGASISLSIFERGVIATDVRGAAVRLLPDGTTAWVVGGLEEPLARRVAPALMKGTLVLPGLSVRLIDALTGRVLASTPKEPELTSLAVSKKLELYTLAENGGLTRFDPAAVFAVI